MTAIRYGNQRSPGINKHQRVKKEVFHHYTEGISQRL
jgi:hypothetical protein